MKKIEAILKPDKIDLVREKLEEAGFNGISLIDMMGHGKQKGITQEWNGESYRIELLPKVKLEMIVNYQDVDKIISIIKSSARTGGIGDGKIFVSEIAEAYRIRNDETGEAAL
ncbi:MAG TPA: P-II family nitrogen regulator [Elusimicrobia bacterium]|nr:MAG: transcriptional regulator [Elusimicrobia bacterium RIFOXYA12_FULL_49_49]OGS10618.1 MAG: transcriptional regulator [Elusimicrobia bacterium RIFOXYB1_FULL_48_9]OGS16322.1 MAG: transcriptional regulator [Elusimicrobia bacterium RIFOXYA2_FULL_47_53]OGS26234.1 MAG: transcriptional regulator [Elusimicrobia bacterium RIFOXYB12_FULL_50_12]OGS31476.1 MAG: transcriptional regulator [Elusimicrobia bacterium RIFOXYB2_FULL_46_23]HBU70510.1 P-II family nitrogen regulator [Elusimicrobiota bacterium]